MAPLGAELTLEVAGPGDVDALLGLQRTWTARTWTRAQHEAALAGAGLHVLVLRAPQVRRADRGLRAMCVLSCVADQAEVHELGVAPPHRRRGLARRLLDRALELAAQAGARSVWLEVRASNVAAQALYRAAGFIEAARRPGYYDEPREDALVLRKNLEMGGGAC